jgi:isopenicillin-N N-acyltransferase-like protein
MSRAATTRENGITYIELEGSPREFGKQQGGVLAQEIRAAVTAYRANVATMFGDENAAKILDWVMNEADFKRDLERWAPHLVAELEGIARSAGVSFDDVLLLQMFEEVYEAAPHKVGIDLGEVMLGHGCTAFNCRLAGKAFNGQNMDYTPNLDGQQLLTRYRLADKQLLSYAFTGQVGGIGANSKGLSLFVTTLPQGTKRDSDGLGSAFLLRLLLEQDSVDAALEKLAGLPRFGTLSYSIADFERSVIVEASADELVIRETSDETPYLVHTNYILDLEQRSDMPGIFEDGEPVPNVLPWNLERMRGASDFFDQHGAALQLEDFLRLFTNEPVNLTHPAFMTLQSALAVYEEESLKLYASAGTDRARGWNEYTF